MSPGEIDTPSPSRTHPFIGPSIGGEPAGAEPTKIGAGERARYGVAFRLLGSFVAITLFAAATSALALYAFNRYRAGFDQLVSNNLPALAAASELAQQSEKLAANAPTLAAVESHFARQAVKQELDDQLRELNRIGDQLERLSSADLSPLKQYQEAFARNLAHLDNMVAQRIDAQATAENARTRLGMLSSRIQALAVPDIQSPGEGAIPDGDPDELRAWAAAASAKVVVLLSTATADNALRLDRLRSDFSDLQQRAQAALSRAPSSYRESADTIETLLTEFGAGTANVFDARIAQLNAAAGVGRALIDNRQLAAGFVGTSQELVKQIQSTVTSRSLHYADLNARNFALFLALTLLCLGGGTASVVYINRSVIRRIRILSEGMRKRVVGEATALPTSGSDEISDMARATEFFASSIEKRERLLREVMELSPVGALLVSRQEGVVRHATRRCLEMIRARAEEFIGSEAAALFPSTEVYNEFLELLRSNGRVRDFEMEMTLADGSRRWILLSADPVELQGQPEFLCWIYDVHDRKLVERQMSALLREFNAVLETIDYGVLFMDADLHAKICNRAFREIWGIPERLISANATLADLIIYNRNSGLYEATGAEFDAYVGARIEAVRRGEVAPTEIRRRDGRILRYQALALADGERMLTYFDTTELRRQEQEASAARDAAEAAYRDLKAAQARLVQAEKMASLGQLTAGIAHEIKNPLNFVNNFAGLSVELLDELKESAASAFAALDRDKRADIDEVVGMLTGNLEKIAEHGRRADGIVKSMLEHSRGASGERREADLNALVEEALNLAYHGARAQDANFNITLERDLDPSIAPIELAPQEITRVLLNLFGNGFYAANQRLRAGAAPDFQPALKVTTHDLGEVVEIRVCDNGTGIPPEIRDKLFQPFFTTKPTGEGTGLGLSISWDIVTQQHGGTIAVDSKAGEFTEFTIRLPRTRHAIMPEAAG
jgi:PAS domain S-box-containing protein